MHKLIKISIEIPIENKDLNQAQHKQPLCFKHVNILKIKHKQIIYMYENENTNRNCYYLKCEASIYRKYEYIQKISIEIPIENIM